MRYDFYKTPSYYIYGAGNRGLFLHKKLTELGLNILGFIDNDKNKWGELYGVNCSALKDASIGNNEVVIVSPINKKEIIEELDKNGILWVSFEDIVNLEYMLPHKYAESDYCEVHPFNFYESPYPDMKRIHENEGNVFGKKELCGIDFNLERQFELLSSFSKIDLYQWEDEKNKKDRYYYINNMFGKGSADVLYYMLRVVKPKRIIEVGSGFSTAVMLDTNNHFFDNSISISCIEPRAERLKSLLREGDNLKINECDLQEIPLGFFDCLEENDILFIDSSHVARVGSDVNYYLLEILPRLKKGVYIHIHDIFYPLEYPKKWIYEGRAYNEMYLLQSFMMYNRVFSIQFFGQMLTDEYPEMIPDAMRNLSGSIWLRKEE